MGGEERVIVVELFSSLLSLLFSLSISSLLCSPPFPSLTHCAPRTFDETSFVVLGEGGVATGGEPQRADQRRQRQSPHLFARKEGEDDQYDDGEALEQIGALAKDIAGVCLEGVKGCRGRKERGQQRRARV